MNTNTPRARPEEARAGLAPTVTARTPREGYARPPARRRTHRGTTPRGFRSPGGRRT